MARRSKPWRAWVVRKRDSGCWIWEGALNAGGYGRVRVPGSNGKYMLAHRLAWTETHGPIPDGLLVLHRCDVPACCNPDHLFLGTQADNIRDAIAKGRFNYNSAHEAWRTLTHCVAGHPFDEENTYHWRGTRRCKACRAEKARERRITLRCDTPPLPTAPVLNARKTHCPKGHEYTEANTRIEAGGWRKCRKCDLDRHQAKYYQRKALGG